MARYWNAISRKFPYAVKTTAGGSPYIGLLLKSPEVGHIRHIRLVLDASHKYYVEVALVRQRATFYFGSLSAAALCASQIGFQSMQGRFICLRFVFSC